jgi:hypothetical protein
MVRFALLQVPQALANVAPTLAAYEVSYASGLSLDGGVYSPTSTGLAPLAGAEPESPQWQVLSSSRALRHSSVPDSAIETVETCMRRVDAATMLLGTKARETLRSSLIGMGLWVLKHCDETRGGIDRFANAELWRVRHKFLRRHGAYRFWLELRDERQREAARWDPVAREAYLSWWYRRIGWLQRKWSWHVPGYSGEDVAGTLLARLIEAIDGLEDEPFLIGGAPGIEGTFSFLVKKKRWLQRRQQIREVVPREAFGTIGERTPTGEDLVMAREQRAQAEAVLERAGNRMRPRQRRYFEAVLEDAREHEYVSEVRIAERLGVHKSTVSRAVRRVVEALTKSGADEVLDGLKPDAPRARRRQWRSNAEPLRLQPSPRVATGPRPRPGVPQPPWLDEHDLVRIRETGEEGIVRSVEQSIVGPLYCVRCDGGERRNLPREALEYLTEFEIPF